MTKSADKSKREVILDVAADVFAANGFYRTKMEDIAEKANIGKGTIYEYFSGKTELFKEMLLSVADSYLQALKEEIKRGKDIREKLCNIFLLHLEFLDKRRYMMHMMFYQIPPLEKDLWQAFGQKEKDYYNFLYQIAEEAVQRKEVCSSRVPALVYAISGVLFALGSKIFFSETEGRPREKEVEEIVDLILNGAAKEGG